MSMAQDGTDMKQARKQSVPRCGGVFCVGMGIVCQKQYMELEHTPHA